jgi:hypothetical protein
LGAGELSRPAAAVVQAAFGAVGGGVSGFLSYKSFASALKGGLAGLSGAALSVAVAEGLKAGNDCDECAQREILRS